VAAQVAVVEGDPDVRASEGKEGSVRVLGLVARLAAALACVVAAGGCGGTTQATESAADFVVAVGSAQFVLRVSDAETIRLARERLAGRGTGFPAGPVRRGDGGFNAPWSWHLDPAETRIVEAAIEVCDGTPSYVEAHLDEFPTYCPWGAVIVSER
jgi:hypothetical protein